MIVGIWVCVRPRWAKASLTALEMAETPPTLGLADLLGADRMMRRRRGGVIRLQLGVSTAVGRKKSSRLAFFRLPDSS
jgi:hypothetical protein